MSALPHGAGPFPAAVDHELRTPMTGVIGYTDLLLHGVAGPLSPDQRDMLQRVRSNAGRLQALIEDLLATSPEQPDLPLRPSSGTTSAATTGSAG